MIPTFILQVWLLGLLSFGILGGAIYLGWEWQRRSWGWDPALQKSIFAPELGMNEATALLVAAAVLVLIAFFGGTIVRLFLGLASSQKTGRGPDPRISPPPVSEKFIQRPDGSKLHVQFFGPEDGIPLVLTHGWGLHGGEWNYLKHAVTDRFRLIVWDEPGLGQSERPATRDYSLENLARNLDSVLELAGGKPAYLLGHSIGGMITLTFCRLFPEALGTRVQGLVLTHTTPTNPVRTTSGAAFFTAIEKPVLMPLMYLTIALSPLVWLMNWMSYRNGSMHIMTKSGSFAGTETWPQVEFATSFQPVASPAVLARGMLGMMRYDATSILSQIRVPALVVTGDQDSTTKPEAGEAIRAGVPNARLLTLSPAKHLGLIEHHEKYAAAVREFVYATQSQRPTTV